eukprot:GHRR01024147.1.p3 GENE.GHRR01024147.1~~GHRR01024147.1.p3  ORF type:complete len:105 (+),score=59.05 GHRR01024147.1:1271-1585(+)
MESSIEEQLRDKEAVQAENAAQQALILQHEAEMRAVVEKTQELKQNHQGAAAVLLQRYKQLRGQVSRYNKALEAVISQQQQGPHGVTVVSGVQLPVDVGTGKVQ